MISYGFCGESWWRRTSTTTLLLFKQPVGSESGRMPCICFAVYQNLPLFPVPLATAMASTLSPSSGPWHCASYGRRKVASWRLMLSSMELPAMLVRNVVLGRRPWARRCRCQRNRFFSMLSLPAVPCVHAEKDINGSLLWICSENLPRLRITLDVVAHGSAVGACQAAWEQALMLHHESLGEARLASNIISYSALLQSCSECSEWSQSLSILRSLKTTGTLPDTVALTSVISSCEAEGRWKQAFQLSCDMAHAGLRRDLLSLAATCASIPAHWATGLWSIIL